MMPFRASSMTGHGLVTFTATVAAPSSCLLHASPIISYR